MEYLLQNSQSQKEGEKLLHWIHLGSQTEAPDLMHSLTQAHWHGQGAQSPQAHTKTLLPNLGLVLHWGDPPQQT